MTSKVIKCISSHMIQKTKIFLFLLGILPWGLSASDECSRLSQKLFEASAEALEKAHAFLREKKAQSPGLLDTPSTLADIDNNVEELLQAGANPNIIVPGKENTDSPNVPLFVNTTPLHFAAISTWDSLTEAMLRHGGDPLQPARDPKEIVEGWGVARETPFDLAAITFIGTHWKKEAGANLSDGIFSEESILEQSEGVLFRLLKKLPEGTKISSGFSRLIEELSRIVIENGYNNILEELLEHGVKADGTLLVRDSDTGRPTRIPYTLLPIEQASLRTDSGLPPYHLRAETYLRTLQLLLDHGADPFVAVIKGEEGSGEVTTLLHSAAYYGSDEFVKFLLAKGLDPHAISVGFRNTPERVASIMGHHQTARILREWSAGTSSTVH